MLWAETFPLYMNLSFGFSKLRTSTWEVNISAIYLVVNVGYGDIVVKKFWYCGIWHYVMWQVGTNVLKEPAACIFRVKSFYHEVGGIWLLQNFTTCQYHTRKYAVTVLRHFDLMFIFRSSRSVYQWNRQCRLYDITFIWRQKQIIYLYLKYASQMHSI